MPNNNKLNLLIRIKKPSLTKNIQINRYGQHIRKNSHGLCNNLYHNLNHGHKNHPPNNGPKFLSSQSPHNLLQRL